jgi:HPt (histidine-containing phosphotransfer) domain-containing protein
MIPNLMSDPAVSPTQSLIASLWQRNQPQTQDRLALLDRAAAATASHTLTPELREEATSVAHKLAGSLGMFGFHDGTRIARELELHLGSATPDHATLTLLANQLRASLNS